MRISKGASKGKSFNDRVLAGKVRTLALGIIEEQLVDIKKLGKDGKLTEFQGNLLLRLAPNLLPRLNEVSGPDGGDIPFPIYAGKSIQDS